MAGFSEEFGRFVRGRRGKLSQVRYAARLDISHSYLSHIEQGQIPPAATVTRMAEAVGEEPADWLAAAGYAPAAISEIRPDIPDYSGAEAVPLVGAMGDSGRLTWNDGWLEAVQSQKGEEVVRGSVRAETPVAGLLAKGCRIVFTLGDTPKRGDWAIIREADGTERLVRYQQKAEVGIRVEPVGALGLQRAVELPADIIGVVDGILLR